MCFPIRCLCLSHVVEVFGDCKSTREEPIDNFREDLISRISFLDNFREDLICLIIKCGLNRSSENRHIFNVPILIVSFSRTNR